MSPPVTVPITNFRTALRAGRERRRFSKKDVAARLACSASYIGSLEDTTSTAFPSPQRIVELACLYDLDEQQLRAAVSAAHEDHINQRLLQRAERDAERFNRRYANQSV